MPVFDLSKPGVETIPCHTFGGGWAFPLTPDGQLALEGYFGEKPTPLAPHDGRLGYIVEPQDASDLAEHLQSIGVAWKVAA